jgi:hypothetical protein
MISLNAPTFNPIGSIRFKESPDDLYQAQRRASVTATLDGGVSVYDTGYSVADRTIRVRIRNATLEQVGAVAYLIELYPRLIVSTRAGCFAALVEYATQRTDLTISLRFLETLS